MKQKYQKVSVSIDAMTKPTVDVPFYEVAVLRGIYSQGAVVPDGEPFEVDQAMPDEATEYGRLAAKYGQDAVQSVFGGAGTGGLGKAMAAKAGVV